MGLSLEKELEAAATAILFPPPCIEYLLYLLDRLEVCLKKLSQNPSKSMQNALDTTCKALKAEELLNHISLDVKVFVASCIVETMKVTAPNAPYSDAEMKDIFLLIVEAFENISDTSSCSYSKRVSILNNFSFVRTWNLMLDLECYTLINQMFKHFMTNINESHSDEVFSAMGLVMIFLLDELDDDEITPELLAPLLNSLRKGNKDVLPIAQNLAEKVIENCCSKLKPHMMKAVEYLGFPLEDYSEIVVSLSESHIDKTKRNGHHTSKDNATDNLLNKKKTVPRERVKLPNRCKNDPTRRLDDKVSETLHDDIHLGENLVGSVIRIWCPEENEFQRGVIHEYDSTNKAHKVVYDGGATMELVVLENERWEIVYDAHVQISTSQELGKGSVSTKVNSRRKCNVIVTDTSDSGSKSIELSCENWLNSNVRTSGKGRRTRRHGRIDKP